ncbi:pentapeptide repeat-containing protein [Enterococcus xiangfangensis]|uniref:Pentapeptide repeat-containing protein n=1 Tax=Enterococcus xiangfangensis TaxID=1296537 RepID=A0ABU3FAF9_9ENTE|nr:pentapeptide repeat-containing protein [Enterococcus xiangfangensis]MDT2759037.1 pentapeptide repeat-containing protein [Enterococcus xiangfangensis]
MNKNYPVSPNVPQSFSNDFYLEDEASIEAVHGYGLDYSYLVCENLVLRRSILEKVTMQRTKLVRFEANNVFFKNCDFSNIEWIGGSFHQVVFENCKLTGCNFAESYLRDCQFKDCLINFGSFSATNLKNVAFEHCQLNDSEFFEVRWKHLFLVDNELTNSNWMRTKLAELDFTTNRFSKIAFSMDQLKGLKVDTYQAVVIAAGLGLQIKDN